MKIAELLEEIDPIYLKDLQSKDHHSIFINEKKYRILIIRGLDVKDDGLSFLSRGFVINSQNEIFYYDHEEENLASYGSSLSGMLDFIAPVYARNKQIIDSYLKETDNIEDMLYEGKTTRIFMDIWFDLKKDLSRIDRNIARNLNILNEFYKNCHSLNDFPQLEFKDILEQIQYIQYTSTTLLHRLDTLYNYYASIKNDKLNKNIYLLTLISAVFLPLNLIVGFFGMNTEGLFFKDNPQGTRYVLFVIFGSLILSVFGLPIIRFIDSKILRVFLGRYHIYKKISSKLDKAFHMNLD